MKTIVQIFRSDKSIQKKSIFFDRGKGVGQQAKIMAQVEKDY